MKKLIPFITLALLSAHSFAQTNYPGGIPGCIARWDFSSEGTFSSLPDVSGNGNSGAVTNINGSTGWRGNINAAGAFNGNSSMAQVPHNSLLSPSAITIIALVKPTGFYTGQCQDNNIIYKSVSYFQTGCWGMRIGDFDGDCSNVSTMQELDFAGPAFPSGSVSPSPVINLNQWYFLATTYDGNAVKRYTIPMNMGLHLTGISYNDTYTVGTALTPNSEDVFIGATQNPSFPYWFNGSMDELALFNRALSDAEIQSVYDYLWTPGTSVSQIPLSASSITLYPNPSKGSFVLTGTTNDNQPLDVVITNSIGQVVYKINVTPVNNNIHLPVDINCASGLYTAHIRNESHNQTMKFTVNK